MEKAIAEVAQKIEPLRPRLLGNNQIQIDGIADIPEQDNCVCADKQARKPALGRNAKNCPYLLFQKSDLLTAAAPSGEESYNSSTEHLVFSGEQILHEIVTAFIGIARGACEMMIDSHPGGAAKIICDGKNFIGWFPLTEQPLRVRTRGADCKQFGGDSDEPRKE